MVLLIYSRLSMVWIRSTRSGIAPYDVLPPIRGAPRIFQYNLSGYVDPLPVPSWALQILRPEKCGLTIIAVLP